MDTSHVGFVRDSEIDGSACHELVNVMTTPMLVLSFLTSFENYYKQIIVSCIGIYPFNPPTKLRECSPLRVKVSPAVVSRLIEPVPGILAGRPPAPGERLLLRNWQTRCA